MMSSINDKKPRIVNLLSVCLLLVCCGVNGFSRPHFHRPSTSSSRYQPIIARTVLSKSKSSWHHHRSRCSQRPYGRSSTTLDVSSAAPHIFASLATTAAAVDPLVEAEFLNDMAHVALDFFTLLGPPRVTARLAAIVGRVLVMLADYVPDHKIWPEEFVFQGCMMAAACFGLFQTTLAPMALAAITAPPPPSLRDGKAYAAIFEPFGVSRTQFKTMRGICLDWIDVKPHQVIWKSNQNQVSPSELDNDDDDDGDFIYWLYRGQAEVLSGDGSKVLSQVIVPESKQSYKEAVGKRVLGETHLVADLMVTTTTANSKKKVITAERHHDRHHSHLYPATIAKAGKEGATLLRIHVRGLKFMLDKDPTLAESIRTLVFSSVQDMLMAMASSS